MQHRFELTTLGSLALRDRDGRSVQSVLAQPKRTAVLIYLALARPRGRHQRETLLAKFWGEREQERARKALRQALYYLRSSLGDDVIETAGDTDVGLNAELLRSDVVELDRALREGRLEDAVSLYAGEFLPGFHIDDAPDFERWLDAERDRLRTEVSGATWQLSAESAGRGDPAASLRFARAAMDISLADHAAVLRTMQQLADRGEAQSGAQLYDDFAARWRREYEQEPPAPLQRAAATVRAAAAVVEHPGSVVPPEAPLHGTAGDPASPTAAPVAQWSTPAPRRRLGLPHALAALLAAAMLYAGILATRETPADSIDPRLVQVVPFSSDGDPAAGRVVADWLIQGIAAADVDVVPLGLAQRAGHTAAGPGALRPALIITGSVAHRGDSAFVQASITDAAGRRIGILEPLQGERSNLLGLAESLRQRLLPVLAAHLHENMTAWATAARPPTNFDAYRAFAAGMDEFYTRNFPAATEHYERAIAADPEWVLPRIWLAFSLGNSGAPIPRVQQAVLDYWPRRPKMTRFEAALADYQYANAGLDPEAKRSEATWHATKRLVELLPESEWLYLHGVAALAHNRPRAAMQTLLRADPDRGWLRNWRAYWLMLSLSAHYAGDLQRSLDAARTGFARDSRDWGILEEIGGAQAAMGVTAELDSLAAIAVVIANERQPGAVGPRIYWGRELRAHGFETAAREQFEKAIQAYRQLTAEESGRPIFRAHHGLALFELQRYREALAVFRGLAAESGDLDDRVEAAVTALRLGDDAEARTLLQELQVSTDPFRDEYAARLWTELGDFDEATAAFRRRAELPRPNLQWQHLHEYDWVRKLAREHPPFAELIRPRG